MTFSKVIEFLHMLDSELYFYIQEYGIYIYLLLFLIVFAKTAFVILTFLPGDSLIFACGTLAAVGHLSVFHLFIIFFIAASLGDSSNYLIGYSLKKVPLENNKITKFLPISTIHTAKEFLDEYDKIALTFSRFVPLMRTLTPFIAGFGGYPYQRFAGFNVLGGFLWTFTWLGAGYALGNLSWVEENLMITLTLITMILIVPSLYGFITQFNKKRTALLRAKNDSN